MTCPVPIEVTRPMDTKTWRRPGDLDDQTDDARRIILAVDHDDVPHLAETIAGGVEDRAPGKARDEYPLLAHPSSVDPHAWEDEEVSMMGGRAGQAAAEVGPAVASFPTYEAAQKAVSRLIAADIPARDIAIVGHGLRSIERVTGRLGYAAAARTGAINGLLLGLLFSAILVLGSPSVPIQGFVGVLFVGVAIGMLMSIVAYSLVRRRRDFASVMQVVAERYEVTVSEKSIHRAREVIGAPAPPTTDDPRADRCRTRVRRAAALRRAHRAPRRVARRSVPRRPRMPTRRSPGRS